MPDNNYNPEVDGDKLIDAKALEAALRRFHTLSVNPATSLLSRNPETGRYDNASIQAWLNQYADGEVYGIRDFGANVQKIEANAGLVLQPSTPELSNRNDYKYKKLFMCPRCNGGVDSYGMPYVTAIEHIDRFFDPTDNTFVITPVYWRKVEPGFVSGSGDYTDWLYCDSDMSGSGFEVCPGAITEFDEMRPFILRACYMASTSKFDSKAGAWPCTDGAVWSNGSIQVNSASSRLTAFMNERIGEGLCGWSTADWNYMTEFMRLMLGTNNTRNQACGVTYTEGVHDNIRITQDQPSDGTVKVTKDSGRFVFGETISYISNGVTAVPLGTVVEVFNNGRSAYVTNSKAVDIEGIKLFSGQSPWINGALDNVLGTYGTLSNDTHADPMTDGRHPFKFQNMEFGCGLRERIYNAVTFRSGDTGESYAVAVWHSYAAMANGTTSNQVLGGDQLETYVGQGRCSVVQYDENAIEYEVNGCWPVGPLQDSNGIIVHTAPDSAQDDGYRVELGFESQLWEMRIIDSRRDGSDLAAEDRFTEQGMLIGCRASTLGKSKVRR